MGLNSPVCRGEFRDSVTSLEAHTCTKSIASTKHKSGFVAFKRAAADPRVKIETVCECEGEDRSERPQILEISLKV